jgi:hypothetical protein
MFTLLDGNSGLSDFADICQIGIAAINLYFVGYLLFYQLRKDTKDKNQKEIADKESLRLQWFKELIIHPNLSNFFIFYDNLSVSCDILKTPGLTDDQKAKVVDELKQHLSLLRKQLVDLLLTVNLEMNRFFKGTLDKLIDDITDDTFSPKVDLTNSTVYAEKVTNRILETKKVLVEKIINYSGN